MEKNHKNQPKFCVVLGDYTAAFGALINKQCFADQYFGFPLTINPGQLSLFSTSDIPYFMFYRSKLDS